MVHKWQYKPYMVHLRARLAVFIRDRRGDVPQRVFARKIGVAQSTIMRIENQDQNVTLETLEQLCKAFHLDVGDLFPAVSSPLSYRVPVRKSHRAPMVHEKVHEKVQGNKTAKTGPQRSGSGRRAADKTD